MTAAEHTQTGATHEAAGWVVSCSCGWHSAPCPGPWYAGRRWGLHQAQIALKTAAAL